MKDKIVCTTTNPASRVNASGVIASNAASDNAKPNDANCATCSHDSVEPEVLAMSERRWQR